MTSKLKCPYTEEELEEIRNNFKGDKLVCPFCQQYLRKLFNRYTGEPNYDYECGNCDCDLYGIEMPETVWFSLIQAKQDLEIARKALKKIESTEWYDSMSSYEIMTFTAMKALTQIEHKNNNKQKGTKNEQ